MTHCETVTLMQTPLALFNGSYVGERPTGIGVVARDLAAALGPEQVPALWPQGMAPDQGSAGHARPVVVDPNATPVVVARQWCAAVVIAVAGSPLVGRGAFGGVGP